jgi:hypothetical protein
LKLFHEVTATLVHTLLRAWRAVHVLVHRRCICAVHELELHRCICVVHELELHRGVRVLAQHHHGGRVVHEPEHRRCICVVHELAQHRLGVLVEDVNQNRRGVRELAQHHHGGRAVHELELHRCICVVRELDDLLHTDHEIRAYLMAFRHLYVVVFQKDSRHHCCAWRRVLRRVAIQLYCEHLGRVVRGVLGIQPLPPWTLALRASWPQFVLPQYDEVNRLLAWIQYRGRGLVRAFGRAAFS